MEKKSMTIHLYSSSAACMLADHSILPSITGLLNGDTFNCLDTKSSDCLINIFI